MNCATPGLLALMLFAACECGAAGDRVDEAASERFEACLDMSARTPIEDAVAAACPATAARSVTLGAPAPEVTARSAALVLRTLGVADRAGMCAEAPDREPAVAAMCALLSTEQYTLGAVERRRKAGVAAYAPVRISVRG